MNDHDLGIDYWIDKTKRTEALLLWALRYIAGDCDPEIGEIPPHDCEFETNPEKGCCDFHEKYYVAFELITKDKDI